VDDIHKSVRVFGSYFALTADTATLVAAIAAAAAAAAAAAPTRTTVLRLLPLLLHLFSPALEVGRRAVFVVVGEEDDPELLPRKVLLLEEAQKGG
jgi:hypothetical protein